MADRPTPPMARNFVDGLGYTVHRDILAVEDCKTTWGRVEKFWGGRNQVPQHFDPVFNVKPVEERRKDPALPQRYMSKPSKTSGMASGLIKKFINSINDRVPDPFEDLFDMPCSIIVLGAESGDQLPDTDVSPAPDVLPPPDRYPRAATSRPSWPSPPSTASTSRRERHWGRPRRRGGARSSSNRGRSLSSSALPGTTGSPPPPGKRCRGHCSHSGPPIGVIRGLSRIQRISTPPSPWSSRTASACWTGRAGRTCPLLGNCCYWGLDWRLGSGWPPGTWWTTSSAPPRWS